MKSDYSIQPAINDEWPKGHIISALVPYTRKPASLTIRKELKPNSAGQPALQGLIYLSTRRFYNRQRA